METKDFIKNEALRVIQITIGIHPDDVAFDIYDTHVIANWPGGWGSVYFDLFGQWSHGHPISVDPNSAL
jgi:hypothetical protein